MKARTAMEGVGAALALLSAFWLPFVDSSNLVLYHNSLPVTNTVGGLLVDLLCGAILVAGVLLAVQYLPRTIQRVAYLLLAGLILWHIADAFIGSWGINSQLYPNLGWRHIRKDVLVAVLLLSGLLASLSPRIAEPVVRASRLIIAAFAFSALWIVPQLLHLAVVRGRDESTAYTRSPAASLSGPNRRIIWILFDELSYNQTLDKPAAGLMLPNFDRMRAQGVSFSNLKPAGYWTDIIIPALFLGRPIGRIRSTVDGNLLYKDDRQKQWLSYDANGTLFAVAQRSGWTTGVDGWFNPYCRILAPFLNACSSEPNVDLPLGSCGASEDKSILANAAAIPLNTFLARNSERTPVTGHIQEFLNVMARTQALIQNNQIGFVFLHLPVPHPPGIYDRQRHELRSGGTYLDNLVLADDTLGTLMQEIDATPSAGQTTVIVSSDHSWRIPMWRPAADWSTEEERASGGRFDERPVLLVHFPGQTAEDDVTSSVPELMEHDIIAGMLQGKIESAEELQDFVSHSSP